jgi:uncharacterized Zn finger protein
MSRFYDWNDWGDWYTPTTPKTVTGGIKARNQRGAFAKKWWGKRWIEVLESFRIGGRLNRGKNYARKGQVTDLDIATGSVKAKVQGSRSGKYTVSIKLKSFSDKEWDQVISMISEHPAFAASLLSGEMPQEMEEQFSLAGLSLFPEKRKDLQTSCSCPDPSNPCKHIAAVFYLMAEAFDEDPFLLFTLRGMDRETFLARLQGEMPRDNYQEEELPTEPLPEDPQLFWSGAKTEQETPAFSLSPETHGSLPKRLGSLPFWRAEEPFLPTMESIYKGASLYATQLLEQRVEDEE